MRNKNWENKKTTERTRREALGSSRGDKSMSSSGQCGGERGGKGTNPGTIVGETGFADEK